MSPGVSGFKSHPLHIFAYFLPFFACFLLISLFFAEISGSYESSCLIRCFIPKDASYRSMLEYLVFVAAAATLLASFVYVRSMFRGCAKPNRVSWLMWSIAPFIGAVAAVSNGVGWAVLPVFMSGLSPFIILVSSFVTKKAFWKLSSFDYACGAVSGLALVLWYVSKDPNVAIAFAIAADGLASVPTVTKAWVHPESESVWPYAVGVFSPLTSFGAATVWTFSALAFPTYLTAINILMLFSMYNKKLVALLRK